MTAPDLKIVTGVDDHSRFCVAAGLVTRATARAICDVFKQAMLTYGVPDEVLTDNGKVFTGRFGTHKVSGGDVEWVDLPEGSTPSNPTWSPDGEWIAYGATDESYESDDPDTLDSDLFLMSPDGAQGLRLEEEPSESIPGGWSPDGRYLSFASDRLGSWDIFVIDVETREVTPIVTHRKNDWSPDWWGP